MTSIRTRWLVAGVGLALTLASARPVLADWAKGVQAYRDKDYRTAVAEFERVTKTNPDYAGAYYMLGLSQQALGKLSQALASLRKAVQLDGADLSYRLALGQALVQGKQYGDAYNTLSAIKPSALQPGLRSTHALLFAQAATKTDRAGEAVRLLDAQTRADARNAKLFQALGTAEAALGDDAKAFAAFKTAYDLDSRNAATARNAVSSAIAVARRSSSNQVKARYYSEAASIANRLATASATFEHLLLAGEAWLGAKRYDRALSWFEKAQTAKPQNALVHFYRAQCLTFLNRLDDAASQLQEALKIGASGKLRTQIYNQGGYVFDKKKDYARAAQWYQEAGNSKKVVEMRDKQAKAEQNRAADQEQAEFRRKLKALELQITELEKLGEVEQANQLREELNRLKQHVD